MIDSVFWDNVLIKSVDDCWEWKKGKHKDGYGKLSLKNKTQLAHRVAYFLSKDLPLVPWVVIRHTCDNSPCCNPHHLVEGTQQDNIKDMQERQRNRDGETHQFSKLTSTDIPIIFNLKEKGMTHQNIANQFSVDTSVITRILNGQAWQKTQERLGVTRNV